MSSFVRLAITAAALLTGVAPANAQEPSDWVGIWAPDGVDYGIRVDIDLNENGTLRGDVNQEGNNPGDPIETFRAQGRTLELTLEYGGPLTMELARDGQSATIRGRYGRGRISVTLKRRGWVWNMARVDTLDMMHDDQEPGSYLQAAAEDIEAELRRAGRTDSLNDQRQGMCIYDRLVSEWERRLPPRERAELLLRVAGSRSFCDVHQSELADPASCERLTIADSDGATTVRSNARSRSESVGTLPNGTTVTVASRRGRWVRVEGATAGWIHTSNAHCAATR